MRRLDPNQDTLRIDPPDERIRDLRREALLKLRAGRRDVDRTGKLARPDDTAVAWDVDDVRRPDERQEVVFADREERNALENDHLLVRLLVEDLERVRGILIDLVEELGVHRRNAAGRIVEDLRVQAVPSDSLEDLPHPAFDPVSIHRLPLPMPKHR